MATHPLNPYWSGIIRRARRKTFIGDFLLWIVLFTAAGDMRWWQGWLYTAVLVAGTLLPLYGPLRVDEGLIQERMSRKQDAKQWDRIFLALVGVFTLAELVVPGLDHRWGWTRPLPVWMILLGLAMVISGTTGLIACMRVNRFFSAAIRIQKDRGHTVISSGPYRIVRHPGYATWGIRTLGVPLLLGSLWAYVPAGLFVATFIVRTVLEERVLHAELPGYAEYAATVRSRLVPRLW